MGLEKLFVYMCTGFRIHIGKTVAKDVTSTYKEDQKIQRYHKWVQTNYFEIKCFTHLNQGVQYPNLIAGRMVLDLHLCDNDHT